MLFREKITNSCWPANCSLCPPSLCLSFFPSDRRKLSSFNPAEPISSLLCCKSPVWWLFWHGRPCMCTTSAGCVESGHNHGKAEALMDPWKALYVCICGYGNWAPPFVNWPIWQALWLGPCTDICICVCVTSKWCVRFTCYYDLWNPALMLDTVPWFGFVPHYQSQLAGGTQLHTAQIQLGLFFLCSSIVHHRGELWCHSTLPPFNRFLCILNTHTGAHTQVNTRTTQRLFGQIKE